MVKVISTPGPKAIYIEKLKLAVLYKLDNHEIFPRLRGLFSSIINKTFTNQQRTNNKDILKAHQYILNETSKPPLNIFSNILTHMIHKWLQFTLNMGKSIKLNRSKFHFHKLKLTCSID